MGLSALDTNVLIRYVTQDDAAQYRLACDMVAGAITSGQPAVVTLLVILESEWVLRSAYQYDKAQIIAIFSDLLVSKNLFIEDETVLVQALRLWETRAVNFANCLILAKSLAMGCSEMFTFDKRAAKKLPNCLLLGP